MNIQLFLIIILSLINFCTIVFSENAYYIIGIRRNKSDKNYYNESTSVQDKIDKLVNDRMNDIYDVIQDNKETYYLENGDMDQKLDELNSNPLKKRNKKDKKFLFINKTKQSNKNFKRSLNSTESFKFNDSFIEYIPFESNLVSYVCPISNYYAIIVYLSEDTLKIVCNDLDNILYCEKSITYNIGGLINNNYNINDAADVNINHNYNDISNENKYKNYYNIEEIKKETNWSDISVQSFNYPGYPNYLSLISQSPFNINYNKTYDENYYYPSSAGQGIDIYIIDQGLNINHDDFDTYKGESYERTISCDAISTITDFHYTLDDEKKVCTVNVSKPYHGILTSSMAGGKIFGVAKKANIHMIASDFSDASTLKSFDYILKNGKKHKTIISMSYGGMNPFNQLIEDKINDLINEGFIMITSAGNDNTNACASKYNHDFRDNTGYKGIISVGAVDFKINNNTIKSSDNNTTSTTTTTNNNNNKLIRSSYSNFGKYIDIFAPGHVIQIYTNSDVLGENNGTSFSTPIVAGVAATIMSEHPEIEFHQELMKKTLIDMSIKDIIEDIGSDDTPNRFINNGKKIVYSPDDNQIKCGIISSSKLSSSSSSSSINTFSCSNDECCTKEGICVKYNDKTYDKCMVENGCQSEFGKCITSDITIKECENEIMENKECLMNDFPLNISVNMIDEDYDGRLGIVNSLLPKCTIFNSDKCMTFYRNQYSNISLCSIAKNHKSFEFIDTFNNDIYNYYKKICTEVVLSFCISKSIIYENCKIEANYDSESELINNINYIDYQCQSFKSDKCQEFYKNEKSNISMCYSSKDFNYKFPENSKVLEESYKTTEKICEHFSEVTEKYCKKNLEAYDECYFEISNKDNDQEKVEKCNSIINKIVSDCEKELQSEENKECLLINNISKINNEDLLENCKIYNSEKCQKFYNFENNSFVCTFAKIYGDLIGYKIDKKFELLENNINFYNEICNLNEEEIFEKCHSLFIENEYFKCYINEKDINNNDEEELADFCVQLKSQNCQLFYNNNEFIINYPYCQSYLNKLISNLKETKNYGKKFCRNYTNKNKEAFIEKCNKELLKYKECDIGELSSDINEAINQCRIFSTDNCYNYYYYQWLYLSNCIIVNEYSLSDIYNQLYLPYSVDEYFNICYYITKTVTPTTTTTTTINKTSVIIIENPTTITKESTTIEESTITEMPTTTTTTIEESTITEMPTTTTTIEESTITEMPTTKTTVIEEFIITEMPTTTIKNTSTTTIENYTSTFEEPSTKIEKSIEAKKFRISKKSKITKKHNTTKKSKSTKKFKIIKKYNKKL
ncbi:hypothetical protein BCR32DRAFT_271075 [Anaeromyces robustus]|uniref:Peptidase S8/S53 domain-containing protein n=1 Tax=Anaeromyces robustus TaxID=1754192 RepID=A0A1Y1WTA0_9FUNG|nr:hypothetical protein BCR32DRAFT_271075 [Anaeromyces robustus]|eukprot:ORX76769.1 hypothetical protein BCR32DRAFT_271075 [Anaeromyces robustus]